MILLFSVTCPPIFEKFKKCFLKCREYGISLNLEKCAFMICFETIIGFIISKGRKRHDPKKIEAIVKILILQTSYEIQVINGMA
jgi:hypothetical protein